MIWLAGAKTQVWSYAVYAATSLLPVELRSFEATVNDKGLVSLGWETSLEENVRQFVPEFSVDGQAFTSLPAIVARNLPSSYTDTHDLAWATVYRYYRLRMVDNDGSESLSPLRNLRYATAGRSVLTPPAIL